MSVFIPGRGYADTVRVRQVWRTDGATSERDRGEYPLPRVENADVAYGAMRMGLVARAARGPRAAGGQRFLVLVRIFRKNSRARQGRQRHGPPAYFTKR